MSCFSCVTLCIMVLIGSGIGKTFAGDLNPPAAPTSAGSAMYTLEDIYNRLDSGISGSKRSGSFTEPTLGPGAGGRTLDEVMEKAPTADDVSGAAVSDVLEGKTFWGLTGSAWGIKTGTMTNNGAGEMITPSTSPQTVAAGYWFSPNTVSGDTDLTPREHKERR